MAIEQSRANAIHQLKLGELKNCFHILAQGCESVAGAKVQTFSIGTMMPARANLVADALVDLATELRAEATKLRQAFGEWKS